MENSTSAIEDGTDEHLIEDICQLKRVALGEGAAACQVCGTELPAGAPVTVFAYRPAGRPTYELAYISCGENDHDLPTYFTLWVRDLLVDGHVGRCTDPTSETFWPVLLDPAIRAVPSIHSTTARIAPVEPEYAPTPTRETTNPSDTDEEEITWVYGDALLTRASTHDTRGSDQPTDDDSTTQSSTAHEHGDEAGCPSAAEHVPTEDDRIEAQCGEC